MLDCQIFRILPLALVLSTGFGGSASAFSSDPLNSANRTRIILDGNMSDLQARERMQRGLDGLRDQQPLREQNRPLIRPERLEIPKMRSTCPQRIQGNKLVTVPCR